MADFRNRPRFQARLSLSVEEAIQRFSEVLQQQGCAYDGQVRKGHVSLRVKPIHRKLWSPFLELEFTSEEQESAKVRGLIGPSPDVWTAFVTGYAALIFLGFVSLVLGYAQWSLQQEPWGWYSIPILGVFAFIWYALSQVGRHLAFTQSQELGRFFEEVLKGYILEESDIPQEAKERASEDDQGSPSIRSDDPPMDE